MKILLISDTHSNVSDAVDIIRSECDFDVFFHMGDTFQDALRVHEETGLMMRAVSGNMDGSRLGPAEQVFTLENIRFLIVHGDRFAVNRDRSTLYMEGRRREASVICYGHTHVPRDEKIDGCRLVNPGALRPGSGSYGVMTIKGGKVDVSLRTRG